MAAGEVSLSTRYENGHLVVKKEEMVSHTLVPSD